LRREGRERSTAELGRAPCGPSSGRSIAHAFVLERGLQEQKHARREASMFGGRLAPRTARRTVPGTQALAELAQADVAGLRGDGDVEVLGFESDVSNASRTRSSERSMSSVVASRRARNHSTRRSESAFARASSSPSRKAMPRPGSSAAARLSHSSTFRTSRMPLFLAASMNRTAE
jgi:hypothetical protein